MKIKQENVHLQTTKYFGHKNNCGSINFLGQELNVALPILELDVSFVCTLEYIGLYTFVNSVIKKSFKDLLEIIP